MLDNKPVILISGTNPCEIGLLTAGILSDLDLQEPKADAAPDDEDVSECSDMSLVHRIIQTSQAVFVEAHALEEPYCSLPDYVQDIEDVILEYGIRSPIDVTWFHAGSVDLSTESEWMDFIRSAAATEGVLIALDTSFSNPRHTTENAAFLTGLAGDRIVIDSASFPDGQVISTPRRLVELTRKMLARRFSSDREKDAFQNSWDDLFSKKIDEWHELQKEGCALTVARARQRAQEIVSRQETSLGTDIGEAAGLIVDLICAAKNKEDTAAVSGKAKSEKAKRRFAFESELRDNIAALLYEVAAHYGCIIPPHKIDTYLSVIPRDLPEDAADVTFAAGTAAGMVFDIPFWGTEDYKAIFRDVLREAKEDNPELAGDDDDGFDDETDGDEFDGDEPGGDTGDITGISDGYGKQTVSHSGTGTPAPTGGEAGDGVSEAFFDRVTESIRRSWAEKDESAAAASSGDRNRGRGVELVDAASKLSAAAFTPQLAVTVPPSPCAPAEANGQDNKPKKCGRPAKGKTGPGAKNVGVKPAGKKRTK
jgi:hypothetical protein